MCATRSRSNDQLHPPGGGCRQFGAAAPFWCPPGKPVSTSAGPKVRRVPSRRANSVAQRARRYTAAPRPAPFMHSAAGSADRAQRFAPSRFFRSLLAAVRSFDPPVYLHPSTRSTRKKERNRTGPPAKYLLCRQFAASAADRLAAQGPAAAAQCGASAPAGSHR